MLLCSRAARVPPKTPPCSLDLNARAQTDDFCA